jgi:hypothetical protein
MLGRHKSLFTAHKVIFSMQLSSLKSGNFALMKFSIDAMILPGQPMIYFGPARMQIPARRGGRYVTHCDQYGDRSGRAQAKQLYLDRIFRLPTPRR